MLTFNNFNKCSDNSKEFIEKYNRHKIMVDMAKDIISLVK